MFFVPDLLKGPQKIFHLERLESTEAGQKFTLLTKILKGTFLDFFFPNFSRNEGIITKRC